MKGKKEQEELVKWKDRAAKKRKKNEGQRQWGEDKCKWADGRWQGFGDGATNYSRQTDQCTGHTVKVIHWPRGQAGPCSDSLTALCPHMTSGDAPSHQFDDDDGQDGQPP